MELIRDKHGDIYRRSDGTIPGTSLKDFGEAMRYRRKNLFYTQAYIAKQTGLSRTYINQLEQGKRNPTLTTLIKIASAMHMPAEDLLIY